MYKLNVSYTDYKGTARRKDVMFNLDGREVFKLLPELMSVFKWIESNQKDDPRDLNVEEVREFYNHLEGIILDGYGEVTEDGEHFHKAGKFEFEESAAFSACMWLFVSQPQEAVKLLEGLLPKELFEMVKNADADKVNEITESKVQELAAENERLRAAMENQPKSSE